MSNEEIFKKLLNINSKEEILDFFKKNNIDISDEKFKFIINKFNIKDELDDEILENISGGVTLSSKAINALKLTGCLFLAVGGGFAAGSFYGGIRNKKEADLLSKINSYWTNIVNYCDNNAFDDSKKNDIGKLCAAARTNMARFGREDLNEAINNPALYEGFMNMFSQSPEDIINYHA